MPERCVVSARKNVCEGVIFQQNAGVFGFSPFLLAVYKPHSLTEHVSNADCNAWLNGHESLYFIVLQFHFLNWQTTRAVLFLLPR